VRTDGEHGFVFINNHQRNYPLGAKTEFQAKIQLPGETLSIPAAPITVPADAYPIWPFNLPVGGATLRYSTAQLLCRLDSPRTLVFFAWPGIAPEFVFSRGTEIEAAEARVMVEASGTSVRGIAPGARTAFRVRSANVEPSNVIVLSRKDALNLWKAHLRGDDRLLLSDATLSFDGETIHAEATGKAVVAVLGDNSSGSKLANGTAANVDLHLQTVGELVSAGARAVPFALSEPAKPAPPVKLSAPPRAVAIAPLDAEFDAAGVWTIRVPKDASADVYLDIDYVGDVARVYAGDRFVDDNFYHGVPWTLGLRRFTPEERAAGITLKILPLRKDAPVFIEPNLRPDFGNETQLARVRQVTLRPIARTTIKSPLP